MNRIVRFLIALFATIGGLAVVLILVALAEDGFWYPIAIVGTALLLWYAWTISE